jgi:hypothetical protein
VAISEQRLSAAFPNFANGPPLAGRLRETRLFASERGEQLAITARQGGRLELEVPTTPMRLVRRGTRVVAETDREMPTLTQETVRETLERVRR